MATAKGNGKKEHGLENVSFASLLKEYHEIKERMKVDKKREELLKKVLSEDRIHEWNQEDFSVTDATKELSVKLEGFVYKASFTEVLPTEYDNPLMVNLFRERGLEELLTVEASKKSVAIAIGNGKILQAEADALEMPKTPYVKIAVKKSLEE